MPLNIFVNKELHQLKPNNNWQKRTINSGAIIIDDNFYIKINLFEYNLSHIYNDTSTNLIRLPSSILSKKNLKVNY